MFEPALRALMRRLYRQCDALLVPAESTAAVLVVHLAGEAALGIQHQLHLVVAHMVQGRRNKTAPCGKISITVQIK